ncbi:DUF4432 domain-containing protein [Rhizobium sp. 58]|nr:DUF4432 domain-containing protein [Rhizobium sp. 58]
MSISISSRDDADGFQILLDRQSALDIGAFVVDGTDLAPGIAIPSDGDLRIDHALQGFFFTCGPDHVRHPEPIAGGPEGRLYPLHGSLCGTPVGRTEMTGADDRPGCFAETSVDLADGGTALVSRHWAISDGASEITLSDRVTNTGETAFAPMLMYHMNIGGWLCGESTLISGAMMADGSEHFLFGEGDSAHLCLPAAETAVDGWARLALGPFEALGGRSLQVRFRVDTLPFLQIWRCQRGTADVVSIEPVSHRIASRTALAEAGELPLLHPGETIDYALAFRVG